MKDSEKVWFLYIINIDGMTRDQQMRFFNNMMEYLHSDDESIKQIFVASRTEPTSVKLVYDPKGNENGNNEENLRLMNEFLKNKANELCGIK